MTLQHHCPLILASGSSIRQIMLRGVGLQFSVVPSGLDEDVLKHELAKQPVAERALALAAAKAQAVSRLRPEALVIGADQMCALGDTVLDKPGSYPRAEAQLASLSGQTHQQVSAVALARAGEVVWRHVSTAQLTLRTLGAAEIAAYVAADAPLQSCGAYKFEGMGRHLFASIQGDNDTIQGLPLVPLLAELHRMGAIAMKP